MTMTMTMTHALTMPISEQHTHACRQQKSTFIIYPFSITKWIWNPKLPIDHPINQPNNAN
jgi:hypothetical protein